MVDVVGSFMKGFQAGQGIVDTINDRERRETLQEREDTLFEQSQQDRAQRLSDAQTRRERGETLWQQSQEDRAQGLEDAEAQRKRLKTLQGREDTQWKQSQEQYNHQQTLQRRQQADQMTADWLNSMSEQGKYVAPPPELEDFYEDNPHLDISNILTPENVIGRQQARQLMQELAQGQTIDPRDPRLVNSINQLFPEIVHNPNLPQTHNGQPIVSREISSVDMGPQGQGFMVTQRLTLGNGTTVEVPVTENRSGEPSDKVVVVPFQAASQRLSTLDGLDLNFDDDMKQQLFRSRVMRGLAKTKTSTKDRSGIEKQMLARLDDIDTQEQEAMSFAQTPEEQNQIRAQYQQMRQRTRDTYNEFISDAGRPTDRTRTDTNQFQSQVKAFETAASEMNIDWTPEVKAEVEAELRAGTDPRVILQAIQEEYGTNGSSEDAESVLSSILSDIRESRSGELGETYQRAQSEGLDIPPPEIQPTQTATGTPEEIAERARLAQAQPRNSRYDVSQAPGLSQAYGAQ